jgi:hypothetical protein
MLAVGRDKQTDGPVPVAGSSMGLSLVGCDFDVGCTRDHGKPEQIPSVKRVERRPTRLLVYYSDFNCSHSVVVNAKPSGDHVRLSDLEPKFTCKACGRRGADIRPLFE